MRRADAPPAGWYPDPTGGARLWWWDGTDWSDHQRVPPPDHASFALDRAEEAARNAGERRTRSDSGGDGPRGGHGVAPRIRDAADRASSSGLSRRDASALVEEVRQATRGELQRATRELGDRAGDVRSQLEPLISEYGGRLLTWSRRALVAAVVVWLLWTVGSGLVQVNLLEWLGDRIDQATGGGDAAGTVPADTSPLPGPVAAR